MGRIYGADVEQLDALGRKMATASEQLNAMRIDLEMTIRISEWRGGEATYFRDQWDHHFVGALHAAASAAQAGSAALSRNAEEQRRASEVLGGAATLWSVVRGPVEGVLGVIGKSVDMASKAHDVVDEVGKLARLTQFPHVSGAALGLEKQASKLMDDIAAHGGTEVVDHLGLAGKGLGALWERVPDIGTAFSVAQVVYDLKTEPHSDGTYNDEVGLGLGLVASAAPAVLLAVGVAAPAVAVVGAVALGTSIAYGVADTIDPQLTRQIAHGVATGAKDVANWTGSAANDVFQADKAEVHVLGKVAGAATDAAAKVVSGGVHAVLSFL